MQPLDLSEDGQRFGTWREYATYVLARKGGLTRFPTVTPGAAFSAYPNQPPLGLIDAVAELGARLVCAPRDEAHAALFDGPPRSPARYWRIVR